jgi:hypothetical protein
MALWDNFWPLHLLRLEAAMRMQRLQRNPMHRGALGIRIGPALCVKPGLWQKACPGLRPLRCRSRYRWMMRPSSECGAGYGHCLWERLQRWLCVQGLVLYSPLLLVSPSQYDICHQSLHKPFVGIIQVYAYWVVRSSSNWCNFGYPYQDWENAMGQAKKQQYP